MNTECSKEQFLIKNGFKQDFDTKNYYNLKTKKVFTVESVQDNDHNWLIKKILEKNEDWEFYSNNSIDEAIKSEFINRII